jgi:hypothetical protein
MEIEPDVQRSVELLATWGDKIEEAMHEAMLVDSYKMQVNLDGEEEDKPGEPGGEAGLHDARLR